MSEKNMTKNGAEKTTDNFIFCDGASKGNPGPGGWAAIVVKDGHAQELGGGEKDTTNNRMELTAALRGLQSFFANNFSGEVTVYTDSSYVINGIKKWVSGWKKNGWMTKAKQSVLHRDLWEGISEFQDAHSGSSKISWVHVKGHSGIPLNERCDEIATGFAATLAGDVVPALFSGPRKDYKVSTELITKSASASSTDSQKSKKSRSQAKAFSYVSAVGGKVEVHQDWASCEKRVKGASGARFKKVFSKAEETELVRKFGGK